MRFLATDVCFVAVRANILVVFQGKSINVCTSIFESIEYVFGAICLAKRQ